MEFHVSTLTKLQYELQLEIVSTLFCVVISSMTDPKPKILFEIKKKQHKKAINEKCFLAKPLNVKNMQLKVPPVDPQSSVSLMGSSGFCRNYYTLQDNTLHR